MSGIDLQLKGNDSGDITSFIPNGEWHLIGNATILLGVCVRVDLAVILHRDKFAVYCYLKIRLRVSVVFEIRATSLIC